MHCYSAQDTAFTVAKEDDVFFIVEEPVCDLGQQYFSKLIFVSIIQQLIPFLTH